MAQLLAGNGSAAAPSYTFTAETTTGIFLTSAGIVSFSSSGTDALDITSTSINVHSPVTFLDQQQSTSGLAGTPSITFSADNQTGFYRSGVHIISISAGGIDVIDFGATSVTLSTQSKFFGDNRVAASPNTNFVLNTSAINRTGIEQDVYIGVGAGDKMAGGGLENNVFVGYHAGNTMTGQTSSVIIGCQARETTTGSGSGSVHIGAFCGQTSSGGSQTMIGYKAGPLVTANCTIIGFNAASMGTSISNSTIVGGNALPTLSTGTSNTAVGDSAGTGVTTGSSNSFFGRMTAASSGVSFGTAIGASTTVSASNTIQLGRVATDSVSCGSSLSVHGSQVTDSNGHLVRTEGSGAVTVAVGAGAGTGATAVLAAAATDSSGQITLTTGTGTVGAAVLVNLTFASSYSLAPVLILTPANAAAATLSGVSVPFVTQTTTTGSSISANSALAVSTVYSWWYHVMH